MRTILRAFVGLTLVATAARAESAGNYTVESRSNTEVFTTKITKVYEFKEGETEYQAYVVNWHDHEVVVSQGFAAVEEKHHVVGDVIRCSMNQTSVRRPDGTMSTRVTFLVTPSMILPAGVDNTARFEAVAAEVAKRRELREAAIAAARAQTEIPSASAPPQTPQK